jgi:hypothetical protein
MSESRTIRIQGKTHGGGSLGNEFVGLPRRFGRCLHPPELHGFASEAIEMGIVEVNPAARLGRFTRIAKTAEVKGISLTSTEADQFLPAAKEICPEYHPLFLMALRAGLRRGSQSQCSGETSSSIKMIRIPNRFIIVGHNYVRREHTTTKNKRSRRVDMSRELTRVHIEL